MAKSNLLIQPSREIRKNCRSFNNSRLPQPQGCVTLSQKPQRIKFLIIIKDTLPLPPSTLGERIRAERLKLGWTGYELADFLGVNGMTIYNWENGGMIYKLKHRRLVSYFLGM